MSGVPASSRGVPSSGGTFTGPLTIAPTSNVAGDALLNIFPPGDTPNSAFVVNVDDNNSNGVLVTAADGDIQLAQGAVEINTAFKLLQSHGYTGAAGGWQITDAGTLKTTLNAAPADAELNAGEMALWFDPTNGAAKLMVKAKQANGTVKTASVALA